SYSLFLDVALYTCPSSADQSLWRTSTTEQLDETPPFILLSDPDAVLYKRDDFTCRKKDIEGTVLRSGVEGAALPEEFPVGWEGQKQPVALYLHDNLGPGKYKTDTNKNGKSPIGYILPAKVCPNGQGPFCGKPLKLFKANNERYLTTTKNPTGPFAGLSGEVLGYLIDLKK